MSAHGSAPWQIKGTNTFSEYRIFDANGVYVGSIAGEDNARLVVAAPRMAHALRVARKTLVTAIEANVDLPDFDVNEHVTIKTIDAALAEAGLL